MEEQKAPKEDRFLRGRQIAYLIYEYLRVIGANDSVEKYADLFTIVLELYKMEIHQEKVGPDYHRIEDNGEMKYRAESTLQGLPQRNLHQFIVKSGILQSACSTSPRVVVDLGKSALICIARLKNSLAKGPKRMVTKVQWLC